MNSLETSPAPRLLLVSYVCDPVSSMEARLGWYRAATASSAFDTTIICNSHNRPVVEGYVRDHGPPPFSIVYVDLPRYVQALGRVPGTFYWVYNIFHKRAKELALQLHTAGPFDIVHQVGLCGYREPSYLWKMDVPFVWGPIGGTQNYPWRFLPMLSPRGAAFEIGRSILNEFHLRFRDRVRKALAAAGKVYAANSTAVFDFQRVHGQQLELQLETGLLSLPDITLCRRDTTKPLRILWAGRLRPWKALPLLLYALRGLDKEIEFEVKILGPAEDVSRYQRLSRKLGLERRIQWLGWPEYEETFQHYAWADVFAFTSLRDTSGTGLLEALAHGTPIVGVDHQGAHDIMTPQCAVPVAVNAPEETIRGFRQAFIDLARNPVRLHDLSEGAVERAKIFHWSRLGDLMRQTYHDLLDRQELSGRSKELPGRSTGVLSATPPVAVNVTPLTR